MAWSYVKASHNSGWQEPGFGLEWINRWSVTEQSPDSNHPGQIKLRVVVVTESYYCSNAYYECQSKDTISYGSSTVTINTSGKWSNNTGARPNYTKDVYVPLSWSGKTVKLYICWDTVNVTLGAVGDFSSAVGASNGSFGQAVPITLTRKVTNVTHTLTVACAGRTETLLSNSSATSASWTPAVATYAPLIPNANSASAVITCVTKFGSATMTSTKTIAVSFAAADVRPTLAAGWAAHACYNTGTAAAGIAAYVQGYSRAELSFDPSKIRCQYGATIAGYTIVCGGEPVTSSPYRTGTLTGTSAAITCTVTDSRGNTASETLSVALNAYARPTLTGPQIFRSDADGDEDPNGTCIAALATANISSIEGLNSYTLTVYTKTTSGAYNNQGAMVSGVKKLISGHSPDTTWDVKLELTDALGNTAVYEQRLATRSWAMKFRPNGLGVGFGRAPELGNAIEAPGNWFLRFGAKLLHLDTIATATEETNAAQAEHAVNSYFLWKGRLYRAAAAIAAGDTLSAGGNATQASVVDALTGLLGSVSAHAATLTDHASALNRISVHAVSKSISIAANNAIAASVSAGRSDGKTPIGIVGCYVSGTGESFCALYKMYLSGTSACANLRNNSSNAVTVTLNFNVLYK